MSEVEIELTQEHLDAMAEYAAIDFKTAFKWVPTHFRKRKKADKDPMKGPFTGEYMIPKKLWPVFEITMLNGVEKSNIEDEAFTSIVKKENGDSVNTAQPASWRIAICRNHIKGWTNFRDRKGKLIEFEPSIHVGKDGSLTMEAIKLLNDILQEDLMNAIAKSQTLNEDELRGLELPLAS